MDRQMQGFDEKFSDFPSYIIEFGPGAYVVSTGFMMECPFGSR
jgi:hypothetical protein